MPSTEQILKFFKERVHHPTTPRELARMLRVSRDDFLVFTNASDQRLAVLYRRKDGNYGLIEPERR